MRDLTLARLLVAALAAALGLCAGLLARRKTAERLCALPRAKVPGILLTLLCWIWVTVALIRQPLGLLPFLTPATTLLLGIVCAAGSCIFLQNLLCARAVGGLMMLWPMPVIVAVRDQITLWRLVPVTVGYISLTLGMFIVFYPWIFRVICDQLTHRPRLRRAAVCLLAGAAILTVVACLSLGKVVGE